MARPLAVVHTAAPAPQTSLPSLASAAACRYGAFGLRLTLCEAPRTLGTSRGAVQELRELRVLQHHPTPGEKGMASHCSDSFGGASSYVRL